MKKISTAVALFVTAFLAISASVSAFGAEWHSNIDISGVNAHVYIPDAEATDSKRPLMINLHGCSRNTLAEYTQSIDDLRDFAKWEVSAEKYGMIVVLPEASHSSGCWNYYGDDQERDNKENDNLLDLVKAFKRGDVDIADTEITIDPKQIYISGLGGGGSQAMVTACLAPEIFSGVGAVAAPSVGSSMGDEQLLQTAETTESNVISTCRSLAGENKQFFDSQIASFIYGKTVEGALWWTATDATDNYVSNKYSILNADVMASIYGANKITELVTDEIDGIGDEIIWKDSERNETVSLIYVDGMTHGWPAKGEPVEEACEEGEECQEGEGVAAIVGERVVTGYVDYTTYVTDWLIINNRRKEINIAPVLEIELNKESSESIELTGTVRDDGLVEKIKVEVVDELSGNVISTVTLDSSDIDDEDEFEYTASGLSEGTYIFKVTVTDDEERSTTRESFEVLGDVLNQRPEVSISSQLEDSIGCISLSGSAKDSDGELAAVLVKFDDVDGEELVRSAIIGSNGSWKISQCGITANFATGSVYAIDNLGAKGVSEYFDIKMEKREGGISKVSAPYIATEHNSQGRIADEDLQYYKDRHSTSNGWFQIEQPFVMYKCESGEWTDEEDDCGSKKEKGINLSTSVIAEKISSPLGDDVVFNVVVSNFGTEDANNVEVKIELDNEYDISDDSDLCKVDSESAKVYICSLGAINDESFSSFDIKVAKEDIGLVKVSASAKSGNLESDLATVKSWVVGSEYSLVLSDDKTLVTTRAGGEDTLGIALGKQPTDDVVIRLISSDEDRGTVETDSYITFTPSNWNIPQEVIVKGNDNEELDEEDEGADRNKTYEIEVVVSNSQSDDENYHDISVIVPCVNLENSEPGITIEKDGDLITTESGDTATFKVRLNTPPEEDVTIPLSSSKSAEGKVSTAELEFTPTNWNVYQTVVITGQDDDDEDGDKNYSINIGSTISSDDGYNDLSLTVPVVNIDNDTAGLRLIVGTEEEDFETSEEGGSATFEVVLNKQPTANVTVNFESSNKDEGIVSPSSYTFTTDNWNTPQTVTVDGVNDESSDGDVSYFVYIQNITSTDSDYSDLNQDDEITFTNIDDDLTAGLVFVSGTNLKTSEEGDEESFSVRLTKKPESDVTISFISEEPSEGALLTGSITFTPENFDSLQTVTVKGVDDDVVDGDQSYAISVRTITSDDEDYADLNITEKVIITNEDNDADVGIEFDADTNLQTSEGGAEVSFEVVLKSKPTSNVTVILKSSDEDEGELINDTLIFTATNWDDAQTVTVKGVDDEEEDGDKTYFIEVDVVDSSDSAYKTYDVADAGKVTIENLDNNSDVGVSFYHVGTLITSETGGEATFSVVLESEPSADVTITFESSDKTEGKVTSGAVVFTPENWDVLQTVTVAGQSDTDNDGAIAYYVEIDEITSDDSGYNEYDGIRAGQVDLVNQETDEDASIIIDVGAEDEDDLVVLETSEAGGTATFTIALGSKPTAAVYIGLASSNEDEGELSNSNPLTFTPDNWDQPQTVTITGVDDKGQKEEDDVEEYEDGDIQYTVSVISINSVDTRYQDLSLTEVDVVNVENKDNDKIAKSTGGGGGGSLGIMFTLFGALLFIRRRVR